MSILAVVAMAVSGGCAKDDIADTNGQATGRRVIVNMVNATRTTVEYPDGDHTSASKLVWNEGDKVSYFISEDGGATFGTAVEAEVNADGTLTVDNAPQSAFRIKVVYPNQRAGSAYSAAVVSATQNQPSADSFNGANLPMEGEADVDAAATSVNVPYDVNGAVLRIKLTASEHSSEQVKKIVIGNADADIVPGSRTVTLTLGSAAAADLSTDRYFYVVTSAGTYDPTMKVVTDVAEYEYDGTFGSREFFNANLYRYALDLDGGNAIRSSSTALDETETANCYLVREGGEYTFNADIAGNGIGTDGNKAPTLIDADGTYGADWLWATESGVVQQVHYNAAWKRIAFTVPEDIVTGSAVIALYREDGGEREIVWSWHIWVNATVADNYYGASEGTWLNANLGARNCNPDDAGSYGFLYQWGRKDPIVGAGVVGDRNGAFDSSAFDAATTASTVVNTAVFGNDMAWNVNPTAMSSADAVAYPMSLFSKVFTDENDNMWVGPASAYKKTMHDPCPAGYRIPTNSNMQKWAAVLNALGTPAEDNATAAMSSLTYGRTYSPTVGGATFEDWLPCAGVRLNTGIVKNIGKFGMIWNAGSTSWQWCGTTATNVKVVSAGSNSQAHTAALSVRCRKM